ncbi:hypothetical protein PC120_g26907 [Phytophthora cactorum]|nr:hypothetical protein PC120_g26907 [Phytophthora cactorum]
MCSANTSFEHVLHNLQKRDRIVEEAYVGAGRFLAHIPRQNLYRPGTALARTLAMLKSRLDELYSSYKQTMDRFNIGIISFISEYYSIADQNSDQFSTRCLHMYSGHREHYSPILPSSSPAGSFDIQELVRIFQEHCYDFKIFKSHSDSNLRCSRDRTLAIYQNLTGYIASENINNLADLVMHEVDVVLVGFEPIIPARDASRAPKAAAAVTRKSSHQDVGKLELGSEGMALFSTLRCMVQEFKNIKLEFTPADHR